MLYDAATLAGVRSCSDVSGGCGRRPRLRSRGETRNFWLFMSMFIVIAVQSVGLYLEWRPDRGRYDNDLKYRYVLMKGEASPKRLSELEELFEVERDQRRIDSMRRDVEKYERLVRRRAALDEQARLKAQEAEQLKRDAAKLKNK
uniref:hypothetical protein n=1 Tax=Alistipes shahii TaxID=328814 RepID=UPI003FF10A00